MKKATTKKPGKTRDALEIIDRMIGDDHELRTLVIQAGVNAHIAQRIYEARTAAACPIVTTINCEEPDSKQTR